MLIKPDGVKRRLVGEILSRIEAQGPDHRGPELKNVSDDLARRHYAEHEGKPFFGSLLEFITSGPVVAAIVEGPRAIAAFRQIAGGTDPVEKAAPGTIRGDLALDHPGQPRARLGFARVGGPRDRALVPRQLGRLTSLRGLVGRARDVGYWPRVAGLYAGPDARMKT